MVRLFVLLLLMLVMPGIARGESDMQISSPAFATNASIPPVYTGEGSNISPPLSWDNVPEDAKSLALIVDDPDAPDPAKPKKTFVHWVLYNIPPTATGLGEGDQSLPAGTRQGENDRMQTFYTGPMPPIGRHRYFFKLYALDTKLNFEDEPTKAELEKAMQGHILAKAELIGTYQSQKGR